jgi:hypothetical protein
MKGREYDVLDEIEILPDDHVNFNTTEEELDSFEWIFLILLSLMLILIWVSKVKRGQSER